MGGKAGGIRLQGSSRRREVAYTSYATFGEDWLRHLHASRGREPSTVKRYGRAVNEWSATTGVTDPRTVTAEHLDEYLQGLYLKGYARTTRRVAVAALRSFFEYLTIRGELDVNPAARLSGPRSYSPEPSWLTEEEIRRLLFDPPGRIPADFVAARNRLMLVVGYCVGLRRSEVGPLRVDEVGWEESTGTYSVLLAHAKASRADVRRELYRAEASGMFGAYLAIRRQWLAEQGDPVCPWLFPSSRAGQLGKRQVARIFHRSVKAARIPPRGRRLSFHVLRHSLATHLSRSSWPARAVQAWMRHRSVKTTMLYVHLEGGREFAKLWRKRDPLKRRPVRSSGLQALSAELTGASDRLGPGTSIPGPV